MKRLTWIDFLRIVLTWGVISIHGKYCYNYEVLSRQWIQYMLIGSMMTCCVPVFIMLSGALILETDCKVDSKLFKRIGKVTIWLVSQMLVCVATSVLLNHEHCKEWSFLHLARDWRDFALGRSFFWILLGCYVCAPLLKVIVKSKELLRYYLLVGAIFGLVVPLFNDLEYVPNIPGLTELAHGLDSGEVLLPLGASYLFVMGYYVNTVVWDWLVTRFNNKRIRNMLIGCFFLIQFLLWQIVNTYNAYIYESGNYSGSIVILRACRYGRYYGSYVGPVIIVYAMAVMLLFKAVMTDIELPNGVSSFATSLAKNCTWIFVVHGCVIVLLRPRVLHLFSESPLLSTIVDSTIYFSCGAMLVSVVRICLYLGMEWNRKRR